MSQSQGFSNIHFMGSTIPSPDGQSTLASNGVLHQPHPGLREIYPDPLLTVEEVARRLKVSKDWVWDHSSRKSPRLPVIRLGDGALRFRTSGIEGFISERERLSALRRGRR
ncbi:MAG: helix-turn-helix domain-containing protein [Terracidiphilus sp.]